MSEENLKERRKAPRYKAEGRVKLRLEDDRVLEGNLMDLSRIGAFVKLDETDESMSYKMASLELQTRVEQDDMLIIGSCTLVRIVAKGVGIHIFDIDPPYRNNFVRFMGYSQKPENAI